MNQTKLELPTSRFIRVCPTCHHFILTVRHLCEIVIISIFIFELWEKTCFVRSQWPWPLPFDHQNLIVPNFKKAAVKAGSGSVLGGLVAAGGPARVWAKGVSGEPAWFRLIPPVSNLVAPMTGFKNNYIEIVNFADGLVCLCGSYWDVNIKLRLFHNQLKVPHSNFK